MSSEDKALNETSAQLVESILADSEVKQEDVEDEFVKSLINTQQRQKTPSPPPTHQTAQEPIFGDEEVIIEPKIESDHESSVEKYVNVHEVEVEPTMTDVEHHTEHIENVHAEGPVERQDSPVAHHEHVETKSEPEEPKETDVAKHVEQIDEPSAESTNHDEPQAEHVHEIPENKSESHVSVNTEIFQIGDHQVEETHAAHSEQVEEPIVEEPIEQQPVTQEPVEEEPIKREDSPIVQIDQSEHFVSKSELDADNKDDQTLSEELTTNASNVAIASESLAQDQEAVLNDVDLPPVDSTSQIHSEVEVEPQVEIPVSVEPQEEIPVAIEPKEEVWVAQVVDEKPAESASVSELADKFKAVSVSPPEDAMQASSTEEKQKVTIDAPASTSNDDGNTSVSSSSRKAKQSEGFVKRAKKYCAII